MATPKRDTVADVIPEAIPEPLTVATLAACHRELQAIEARLIARLEATRSRLRETAPTLDAELVATRTFLLQAHPGSETRQLTKRAAGALTAASELASALTDARAARDTALALVTRVGEQLARVQAEDMIQLDFRDEMGKALVPVKVACSNLGALLDRASPILSLGRVCAGRIAQASLTVVREWRAERLVSRLSALQLAVETLRAPVTDDEQLAALVQEAEHSLETRLPCPEVIWPKNGGPFAPPTLKG